MKDNNELNELVPMPAPPNPVQHEALYRLAKGKVQYIYSDRRQGLLMCWNALWKQIKQGQISKVACPDQQLLNELKDILQSTGLSPLCYFDSDTPGEVLGKLAKRKNQSTVDPSLQLPWQYWKRRKLSHYEKGQQNLFGERNYQIIAREWFESSINGRADILEARVDPSKFQFTPQEFYQLRGRVKEAETIFNPQLSRTLALRALHRRFFTEMDAQEAEEWLYDQLDDAARYTRELLERAHQILSDYKKNIQDERFNVFRNLQEEIELVRDRIDSAILKFGEEFFENPQGLQGRLKQSFSARSKEIDQLRKQIKLAYMELHRSLESSVFGPYIASFEDLSMNSIRELLDLQEKCLSENWPVILMMAQEGQLRLNSRNMEGSQEEVQLIRQLENDIEDWFRQLNDLKIFEKPMEENALSLTKKGEILGHILQMLEETSEQLPRFIPYHQWRSFSIHLADHIRQVIELLGEERNPDWVASLESWYFSQLLARYRHPVSIPTHFAEIPEIWKHRRKAVLKRWMSNWGDIDPDGGWITQLNEMDASQALTPDNQEELDRQFPIQVFSSADNQMSGEQSCSILLNNGSYENGSPDKFDLIISSTDLTELTAYQRLFDPRVAWQETAGILNIKHAEKIKGIRPFAESLIYEISPARLFQAKDLLLISKWPEILEEKLLQRLNIKMKSQDLSQEEDVVPLMEGLLNNDREMCLLIEEGLLSSVDPVWESVVIGWCQQAGFRIISLDWQELWKDEKNWLDTLARQLVTGDSPNRQ